MIQELLYTSHDGKGLRQGGGGGFCTVLSTTGMATNLASALEQLSGYKHPFDIHDLRSAHNPVNYRHAVIRVGGITYYVLSRIADLRHEHTGRSNKLAHHVALTKDVLPPGGPSVVMSHSAVCRSNWDGRVMLVPEIPISMLPKQDMPLGPCRAWEKISGDAGWAGVVAEYLLTNRQVPFSVIAPENTDSLALVNEVLSLLPPQERWGITFSTYFTSLPAGTSCALRVLLDGTQEAEQLRRDYRQKFIDLTSQLGKPPDSDWVMLARTGKRQAVATKPALAQRGDIAEMPERGAEVGTGAGRHGPNSRVRQRQPSSTFGGDLELEPPLGRSGHLLGGSNLEDEYSPLRGPRRNTRSKAIWISVCVVASMMLITSLVGVAFFAGSLFAGRLNHSRLTNDSAVKNESPNSQGATPDSVEAKSANRTAEINSPQKTSPAGSTNPPAAVMPKETENPQSDKKDLIVSNNANGAAEPARTESTIPTVATAPTQTKPQVADFSIPPLDIPRLPGPKDPTEPKQLHNSFPSTASINAQLIGLNELKYNQWEFDQTFNKDNNKLSINLRWPDTLNPNGKKKELVAATFSLADSLLTFQWSSAASGLSESTERAKRNLVEAIRWCILEIEIDKKKYVTSLSRPWGSLKLPLSELMSSKAHTLADIAIPRVSCWETALDLAPPFPDQFSDTPLIGSRKSKDGSSFSFAYEFAPAAGGKHDVLMISLSPNKPTDELLTSVTGKCELYLPIFVGNALSWNPDDKYDVSVQMVADNVKARLETIDKDVMYANQKLIEDEKVDFDAREKAKQSNKTIPPTNDSLIRRRESINAALQANKVLQSLRQYFSVNPTIRFGVTADYDIPQSKSKAVVLSTIDNAATPEIDRQ